MGQRFQIYAIRDKEYWGDVNGNREKIKEQTLTALHLQWCWGHFSIIRANQLLRFFEKDLKNSYPVSKSDYDYPVSCKDGDNNGYFNEFDLALNALSSLNLENGTYVSATLEDLKNPLYGDNNDGFLVLDLRKEKPRFTFGYFKYCDNKANLNFNKDGAAFISALEYLDIYSSENDENDKEYIEVVKLAKKLDEDFEKIDISEWNELFLSE